MGAADALPCTLIKEYVEGETETGWIEHQAMSISSGPKDYFKNDIWELFQRGAARVLLLRSDARGKGWGALFCVTQDQGGHWIDVTGKAVEVYR
jgi:hypothetical protein